MFVAGCINNLMSKESSDFTYELMYLSRTVLQKIVSSFWRISYPVLLRGVRAESITFKQS